jgi:uncharacterized membrane protein YgaE (UPF0421/DUF939 family)
MISESIYNGNHIDVVGTFIVISLMYGGVVVVSTIGYKPKKPFTFWTLIVLFIPFMVFIHLFAIVGIIYGVAIVISNIKKEWDIK